jgi:hypothetical protein
MKRSVLPWLALYLAIAGAYYLALNGYGTETATGGALVMAIFALLSIGAIRSIFRSREDERCVLGNFWVIPLARAISPKGSGNTCCVVWCLFEPGVKVGGHFFGRPKVLRNIVRGGLGLCRLFAAAFGIAGYS